MTFTTKEKKTSTSQKFFLTWVISLLLSLKKFVEKNFLLVTQNIDSLHEKAGTEKILHMHGSLENLFCMYCNNRIPYDFELKKTYICKVCNQPGKVRVDVVWFGEQPKYLNEIYEYLDKTDIFLSVGTSNNVYPAAGFIDYLLSKEKKYRCLNSI